MNSEAEVTHFHTFLDTIHCEGGWTFTYVPALFMWRGRYPGLREPALFRSLNVALEHARCHPAPQQQAKEAK